jgi:cytochrome bd-type quinol oxidase subunit 2
MSDKQDPLKEYLHTGVDLYPDVDLEASIMTIVKEEAAAQQKAQRLRRTGLLFLTGFILLLALALWLTSTGYSHPHYQDQLTNYGFALLFSLVLFAQLEAWWKKEEGVKG